MKCKFFGFTIILLFCVSGLYAQLGIKAGVNIANELNTYRISDMKVGLKSTNLTGYQIGLVYQCMPKKSGFGFEIGALLSQKGSTFNDSTHTGYRELNYLEVPLNLRYRLTLGFIGVYGFGGMYGGYELSGKTVDEVTNNIKTITYSSFTNHVDYGYNFGAGIELFKKIQLGATLSQGLKNTSTTTVGLPIPTKTTNRVYSVNLVYMF